MSDAILKRRMKDQEARNQGRANARVPREDISAPVDLTALKVLTEGDATFHSELVGSFMTSGASILGAIQRALDSGDAKAVERAAHSLKGASASMQAPEVSAAAARLEEAARSGIDAALPELATTLRAELTRAIDYLSRQERLSKPPHDGT